MHPPFIRHVTFHGDRNLVKTTQIGTSIAENRVKRVKPRTFKAMKEIDHIFLSTQELGSLLGVTRQTIRNWIKKGDVKAFHIGQNLKIPASEAVRILMQYGLPVPGWLGLRDLAGSKPITRDGEDEASVSWPEDQTEGDSHRHTDPGFWHRVM